MTLIDRITKPTATDAPKGSLDDELEAEARIKALASSPPRNAMPSPFSYDRPATQQRFTLSIKPTAKAIHISASHPLESTIEDIGGEISISIRW